MLVTKYNRRLVIIAAVLSPFMTYLISELDAASQSYAATQWSKRCDMDGSGIASLLGEKKWPLLQAATGAHDIPCID